MIITAIIFVSPGPDTVCVGSGSSTGMKIAKQRDPRTFYIRATLFHKEVLDEWYFKLMGEAVYM